MGFGVITSGVLVNIEQSILQGGEKKKKAEIIVLADFHGVNTPTMADFQPLMVQQRGHKISENLTISSHESV